MTERLRLVIDTNILISRLLLKNSLPAQAMDRAITLGDLLVSDATLDEVASVLSRPRFERYVSIADRQEFLRRYMQISIHVAVHSEVRVCRDPDDDRFLALAVDGQANCLLTGDKDLLDMHPYRDVAILSPADFLSTFDERASP